MTDRGSPASVRQRLLNLAKDDGVDFQYMLVRYANERLLYRLGKSEFRDRYVLKGATLFAIWAAAPHRPTRDIDLLGYGELSTERLRAEFAVVCGSSVELDGVTFDAASIRTEHIREGQSYERVRVTVTAELDGARIPLQVDVGFGDATEPGVEECELPTLLEFPPPALRAYRPETVIAEKCEAMVKLGIANSRMKDFYDLYVMSREMTFDGRELARAIRATFERRRTALPAGVPTSLCDEFAHDTAKQAQRRAFVRRIGAEADAPDLATVIGAVRTFVLPAIELARGSTEIGVPERRTGSRPRH